MNYPDSPTASVFLDSSDEVDTSSYPVDAQWLKARLAQVKEQRFQRGDDQPLSRFASPSSTPYLDASEEHLDELSSSNSTHYDARDEEPTSEYDLQLSDKTHKVSLNSL